MDTPRKLIGLVLMAVLVGGSQPTVCCNIRDGSGVEHRERCCGKGWGLHCCSGQLCCFGDEVQAATQQRGGVWEFEHWSQWLNITIVILVIAIVTAILVCCCLRGRPAPQLLRDDFIYSRKYDAVPGEHPSAPHWIDFSQKPPPIGLSRHPRPEAAILTPYSHPGSGHRVRDTTSSSSSSLSVPDVPPSFSASDEEEPTTSTHVQHPPPADDHAHSILRASI